MDNVLMIRIVAGVIAVILLAIIIGRRKRMAEAKRLDSSARSHLEWTWLRL